MKFRFTRASEEQVSGSELCEMDGVFDDVVIDLIATVVQVAGRAGRLCYGVGRGSFQ